MAVEQTGFGSVPRLSGLLFRIRGVRDSVHPSLFAINRGGCASRRLRQVVISRRGPVFITRRGKGMGKCTFYVFGRSLRDGSIAGVGALCVSSLYISRSAEKVRVNAGLCGRIVSFTQGDNYCGIALGI